MNSANSGSRSYEVRRRKRLKVDIACEVCRRRKVKCDGRRPSLAAYLPYPSTPDFTDRSSACGNCSKRPALRSECVYAPSASVCPRDSPSPRHASANSGPALGRGPAQQETATPTLPTSGTTCKNISSYEHFGNSSSSAFTGQIKAAIDARSFERVPRPQSPTTTPLVDISLFPSLRDDTIAEDLVNGMEYELPPRKQADLLVNAYWSFVHPLFPVLIRSRFMKSYDALFSGTAVDTNERTIVSTLNAVLALSVQLQESLDSKQRERLSGKYFQRAHALLHVPVWETASVDLIQCLLLMSQYLQCTNKPHQTWMLVGLAVRIAQGIGLHLPEIWANPSLDEDAALKRRTWQSCIIMDRYEDRYTIDYENSYLC